MTAAAGASGAGGSFGIAAGHAGIEGQVTVADRVEQASPSQSRQSWNAFRRHRLAYAGLWMLGIVVTACLLLPFVLPDPNFQGALHRQLPPSLHHIMGTDQSDRDVFARLMNAGRISLLIGFAVAIGSAVIGSAVGVVAGYLGGLADGALMWLVNVLMTIPALPLMIAMGSLVDDPTSSIGKALGAVPPALRIVVVLSALGWMGIARVVRSQVLTLRNQEFVEAARALGAGNPRIMVLHILPNSVSVLAVFTTLAVSNAIMAESALSFLGVGVQPPTASWGNMLNSAKDLYSILNYPWLVWFPALAIFLTVLSVNFVGDGIRDALDPKTQGR